MAPEDWTSSCCSSILPSFVEVSEEMGLSALEHQGFPLVALVMGNVSSVIFYATNTVQL